MKIIHKDSHAVIFSSPWDECKSAVIEAVASNIDLTGADLRRADLWRANLRGAVLNASDVSEANLWGADVSGADLQGANLQGAELSEADLCWVNLRGADLRGANLSGADLRKADFTGADLRGVDWTRMNLAEAQVGDLTIIDGGLRSDGYRFWYTDLPGEGPRISAGCRVFHSFARAREHWQKTRGGTPLGEETLVILNHLERLITLRRGH